MRDSKPLVSMITYCYNGGRFVHRYFEGILAQTYQNIELIFFNNGSKDNTQAVAEMYKEKLEARAIQMNQIQYETHQRTCQLKQKGFRLAHGAYIFGCDSDDVIHSDYIEKMAGYLQAHPEKGIVFCQLNTIREETGEQIGVSKIKPNTAPRAAFEDMLHARNTLFTAISYMMSRIYLEKLLPDMNFYISTFGENYQIQLPFLYENLQGYIEEPLGDYYVRIDSYSGKLKKDPMKMVNAFKGQEQSICATLNSIQPENRAAYEMIAVKRLRRERFYASLQVKNAALRKECWQELIDVDGASPKDKLVHWLRPLYNLKKR